MFQNDDGLSEEWYEALSWVYFNPSSPSNPKYQFIFYVINGRLGYVYQDRLDEFIDWRTIKNISHTTLNNYLRLKKYIELCGPVQPPPSPVIKKIRQMEKRWKECHV